MFFRPSDPGLAHEHSLMLSSAEVAQGPSATAKRQKGSRERTQQTLTDAFWQKRTGILGKHQALIDLKASPKIPLIVFPAKNLEHGPITH